jgi:hypothetical protein
VLPDLNEQDRIEVCASGLVNTGSDAAVGWTKGKLKTCHESHSKCNLQNEHHTLPDRVLKVGGHDLDTLSSADSRLEADVTLYESSGEKSDYAALSHRWGNEQPLRLLLENHAELKHCIPWSALPKTFQHAINFARKLGIQFIWIDSLCVVQDSKEDWLEQSGKMATIYENATVTLAATSSDGRQSGMFVEPDEMQRGYVTDGKVKFPADLRDPRVQELLAKSGDGDVVAFVKYRMTESSHSFPSHHLSSELPLLKRGWVFQERLLSPRIVHFGKIDLIWECNDVITCYCDTWMHSGSRNPISHPIKPQHTAIVTLKDGNENSMAMGWILIVQQYTALDLTFTSDRLAAIAGVAKQFRRGLHNKNYMAGLWEESLLTGLTWARKDPYSLHVRPASPSPGPSWSWVSISGPIDYPRSQYPGYEPSDAPSIRTINFPRGNDEEFTTLGGGSITLHGKLLKGETRFRRETGWQGVEELRHYCYLPGDDTKYIAYLDYGVHDEAARDDIYCLYMGYRMDDGGHSLFFLILSLVDEKSRVYSRVGLCRFSRDNPLSSAFDALDHGQDVTII